MRTSGLRLLTLALLAALAAAPAHAQDGAVPKPPAAGPPSVDPDDEKCQNQTKQQRLKLTQEELQAKLRDHKGWLEKRGWLTPAVPGRAVLCNADLSAAKLQGVNLSRARLQGAYLFQAQLQGADLSRAELRGARLFEAQLQGADLRGAQLQGVFLFRAQLQGADLRRADLEGADLRRSDAAGNCDGTHAVPADFEVADLHEAKLEGARLCWVNLSQANLRKAKLQGASLFKADLTGASLWDTKLQGSDLGWTKLIEADLGGADLSGAYLPGTNLQQATLVGANLTRACYQPATAPQAGALSGLQGLTKTWFASNAESGLVLLREQLQRAGLRSLEREVTYAIEHNKTRQLLYGEVEEDACRPPTERPMDEESPTRPDLLNSLVNPTIAVLRQVAFDWPVAYGLYPSRALLILLGFILVFSVPYMVALVNPLTRQAGIWRVWATDRVIKLREQDEPERLEDDWYRDPWWRSLYRVPWRAFYFSLTSAFHLGWRELNVGTWLARLQTREYTLRATGWVRFVSGLQSLLSVYLLALWALTYFGRPFQ